MAQFDEDVGVVVLICVGMVAVAILIGLTFRIYRLCCNGTVQPENNEDEDEDGDSNPFGANYGTTSSSPN